ALAELGRTHAYVVCGADQLDEVSLWGTTTAFEVTGSHVLEHHWPAKTFGLSECELQELQVQSPAESAATIRDIFPGKPGGARDIVVANSAAALMAARHATEPRDAVKQASQAIDSGATRDLVQSLAKLSQRLGQ